MSSAGEIVLEYVCPVAGCITGTLMFAAPLGDAYRAVQAGSLGDLNPLPWAFMLGNCYGWILYGVLMTDYFVYFANVPGFFFAIWLNLQAVKLLFQENSVRQWRQSMATALQEEEARDLLLSQNRNKGIGNNAEISRTLWDKLTKAPTATERPAEKHDYFVGGMVVVWLAITSIVTFDHDFSLDTKQQIVGISVNLNLVFFYGAPLSTIWTVLRQQSSASIHVPTMLTNTANGAFWCAYGLAVWDLFLVIPNGLGALLGVLQIFLKVTFPHRTEEAESTDQEDEEGGKSQLALMEIQAQDS